MLKKQKTKSRLFRTISGNLKEKEINPTSSDISKSMEKDHVTVAAILDLESRYKGRLNNLETTLREKEAIIQVLKEEHRHEIFQIRQQLTEKADVEIQNTAQFLDSDNQCVVLLAKQCDALQQTVSSLESTLMLRVRDLNETYEDLDTIKSDLRGAEIAKLETAAQLEVHKQEMERLSSDYGDQIKKIMAKNGHLEKENKDIQKQMELLYLKYEDCKGRRKILEKDFLAQEKILEEMKEDKTSARIELESTMMRLEVTSQQLKNKDAEIRKLKREVSNSRKSCNLYSLCSSVKPGETLELISVDLPAITDHIPRGLYIKQGPHGVYIDKIDSNSSAGKLHRLNHGDRIVEINLNDVSNVTFETLKKYVDSPRAIQLVVARVAPDIRNESKLRAEALKDQMKGLIADLDEAKRHYESLQGMAFNLSDDMEVVKINQTNFINSKINHESQDQVHDLKAVLAQKEQYLKSLEKTVRTKNELLVTLQMDAIHTSAPRYNSPAPRSTPRAQVNHLRQEDPLETNNTINHDSVNGMPECTESISNNMVDMGTLGGSKSKSDRKIDRNNTIKANNQHRINSRDNCDPVTTSQDSSLNQASKIYPNVPKGEECIRNGKNGNSFTKSSDSLSSDERAQGRRTNWSTDKQSSKHTNKNNAVPMVEVTEKTARTGIGFLGTKVMF